MGTLEVFPNPQIPANSFTLEVCGFVDLWICGFADLRICGFDDLRMGTSEDAADRYPIGNVRSVYVTIGVAKGRRYYWGLFSAILGVVGHTNKMRATI